MVSFLWSTVRSGICLIAKISQSLKAMRFITLDCLLENTDCVTMGLQHILLINEITTSHGRVFFGSSYIILLIHHVWYGTIYIAIVSLKAKNMYGIVINTLRLRQNDWHFTEDIFKHIFWTENVCWIPMIIALNFVLKVPINNSPALDQIMAWCRPGDKPLSEPKMISLTTHLCIIWAQWVKGTWNSYVHILTTPSSSWCIWLF